MWVLPYKYYCESVWGRVGVCVLLESTVLSLSGRKWRIKLLVLTQVFDQVTHTAQFREVGFPVLCWFQCVSAD